MHPYTTDTSIEAELVQLELIRKADPADCAMKAIRMTTRLILECKNAIRQNHPGFSDKQVGLVFIELNYGKDLANEVRQYLAGKKGG